MDFSTTVEGRKAKVAVPPLPTHEILPPTAVWLWRVRDMGGDALCACVLVHLTIHALSTFASQSISQAHVLYRSVYFFDFSRSRCRVRTKHE